MRIVGILLLTALAAPALGQSSQADPWLDFPSNDSTMVGHLRQGANVKEAKRLLARNSATPETFRRLVGVGRLDDALLLLKRKAGSTLKCNWRLIEKDLVRVLEPERFARPIVEPIHHEVEVASGEAAEVGTFGPILPHQPVSVFV